MSTTRLGKIRNNARQKATGSPMRLLLRLLREEDGPTAVEYAVMLALILIACIGAIQVAGQATGASFSNSRDQIAAAMGGGS